MARYNFLDYKGQAANETAALQMLFDEIGADRTPTIDLNGEIVNLQETVYYRPHQNSQRFKLQNGRIHGADNSFDLIAPDPKLKGMSIAYGGDDSNVITYLHKFDVDNVVFRKGRNQLVLVAQRGSRITNCAFENSVRSILAVFVQHGVVDNCQFQFQDVEAIAIRTGVSDGTLMNEWGVEPDENNGDWFSNANTSNSQSNRFTVRDSWFFGKPEQICQIRVQGSDGVTLENTIHEGAPSQYAIYADSRNSTTTHTINIIRPHIEQGNENVTKSLIYNRGYKNLFIDKLYSQIPGVRVVTVSDDTNIGQVVMDNLEFIPWDNGSFKSDNQIKWIFREPIQDIQNVTWARWDGETPKEIFYQRGVDIYALGTQGISLRSDTKINGRRQRCYFLMNGHTITMRGVNYLNEPSNLKVFKKSSLNDW